MKHTKNDPVKERKVKGNNKGRQEERHKKEKKGDFKKVIL
jgi:hypothetical protein